MRSKFQSTAETLSKPSHWGPDGDQDFPSTLKTQLFHALSPRQQLRWGTEPDPKVKLQSPHPIRVSHPELERCSTVPQNK